MIGLIVNTSCLYSSIAIVDKHDVIAIKRNNLVNKQVENLNLFIYNSLRNTHLKFKDIEYISISIGPGKFNGLRLGVCLSNALHFAIKIPLLPVCNLSIYAFCCKQNSVGLLIKESLERCYFQEFYNSIKISPIKIIAKNTICKVKKKIYLLGDSYLTGDATFLDASHIIEFSNKKLINMKNIALNYLKPQYFISDYFT